MTCWENMIAKLRFQIFGYLTLAIILFIYSYGFLDFNLTLTSNPTILAILAPLQHLVYFNRPLSTKIFTSIMVLMFGLYLSLLARVKKGEVKVFPIKFFVGLAIILTLAYPMLSYDVFNYMFHSKILIFYHQNPHLHAPLEYTGDLWLRFMRWVHTPSAYGPVFTAIELPSYLLGFGRFVPVLYLMKITMTGFFVWCVYLVGKIGKQIGLRGEQSLFAMMALAFNPFLLMDVVVNGHNDAVMMAFFLLSLYYSLKSRVGSSVFSLLASIGTKYVTVITAPLYLIRSPKIKIWFSFLILLLPVVVSLGRFQPWYLVWAIIPGVLVDNRLVRTWIVLSSVAGIIFYLPYISTGFWQNGVPFVAMIVYLPIVLSLGLTRVGKLSL